MKPNNISEYIKILDYLKKNKKITPSVAGKILDHGYYEASTRGFRILKELVEGGLVAKIHGGIYFLANPEVNMREIKVVEESKIQTNNKIHIRNGIHGYGVVVKTYKLKPSRWMCIGCYDNFYNNGADPNGCRSFKSAVVVDKIGHSNINVCNGPDTKMIKTLNCWRAVIK